MYYQHTIPNNIKDFLFPVNYEKRSSLLLRNIWPLYLKILILYQFFQIFAFVLSFANGGEGFKCLYCLRELQTIGWAGEVKLNTKTFLRSKNSKKLDHKSDRASKSDNSWSQEVGASEIRVSLVREKFAGVTERWNLRNLAGGRNSTYRD